ncbi:hypothetical protein CsSME_00053010 [Camellia sinensis var. sinensis]
MNVINLSIYVPSAPLLYILSLTHPRHSRTNYINQNGKLKWEMKVKNGLGKDRKDEVGNDPESNGKLLGKCAEKHFKN